MGQMLLEVMDKGSSSHEEEQDNLTWCKSQQHLWLQQMPDLHQLMS